VGDGVGDGVGVLEPRAVAMALTWVVVRLLRLDMAETLLMAF
jgi:hypothetical protein